MKMTSTLLVAGLLLPLAASTNPITLDPGDPVTASFLRDFERTANAAHQPAREAGHDHDRLPEIFRAALIHDETGARVSVAVARTR